MSATKIDINLIPDQPHNAVSFLNDTGAEIAAGCIMSVGNLNGYVGKTVAAGATGVLEIAGVDAVFHAPLDSASADDYAVGAKVAVLGGVVVPSGTGGAVELGLVALPRVSFVGADMGALNGTDGAAAGGDDMIRVALFSSAAGTIA